MKDFMKLCKNRQSCRSFAEKEVEGEKLLACIDACRLAPSACNSQPWSFVVVKSSQTVAKIAECANVLGRNTFAFGAKAFFVVVEEHAVLMPQIRGLIESQYFAAGDIGQAMAYLSLAATAQGLSTCIMGLFDRDKAAEVLNIPKEKRIRAIIAAGYAKEDIIREKTRKDLSEIVTLV